MKNKTFKINTKKRNIIIASVIGVIAITAGTFFGVKAYNEANKVEDPTPQVVATSTDTEKETVETASSNVTKDETTVAKETKTPATEKPEETKTPAATEETKKPTPAKKTTATEKPAKPTPKPESKHTHNYSSAVTSQPTCCNSGTKTYTCSCGDSYTETISATGNHDYVDHPETKTIPGEPIYEYHLVCDGCNAFLEGVDIDEHMRNSEHGECSYGPRMIMVGTSEPTTETTHHWICSVCGKEK